MTQSSEYPLTGGPSARREPEAPPVPAVEPVAFWWVVLASATGVLFAVASIADLRWLMILAYFVGAASAVALVLTVIRAARALDELVRRAVRR